MSDTAVCVYCGWEWNLEDGMCHTCQNGAKLMTEGIDKACITDNEISKLSPQFVELLREVIRDELRKQQQKERRNDE